MGSVFSYRVRGDFKKSLNFLKRMRQRKYLEGLENLAQQGVDALAAATPKDSGVTADSWDYIIEKDADTITITWTNDSLTPKDSLNIALLLQYGHGTGTGGYVEGYDYINPAIRPIFDEIAEAAWKVIKTS